MQKYRSIGMALLLTNLVWGVNASAQQKPAAKSTTTTASKPTSARVQRKTTAKPMTKPEAAPLTTDKEKQSYALGLNIGTGMHNDSVDIDPKFFLQGLEDALAARKPQLTDQQIEETLMKLQADVRQKQQAKMQALADQNKKDGEAFLAANKTKEGVVTLPSGLQYKILQAGTGAKPTASDSVVCNYRGTLIDGTEFDSSYKRNQPATFGVSQVIKGWTEALQLMPVGSKWQLFIPSELAYGSRQQGPQIGPNSTLVFEVELLSIQGK